MTLRFQLILLLISVLGFAQNSKAKYTLDPRGKKTSKSFRMLYEKYPENAMAFRMTQDSGRVYQYNSPKYAAYRINYEECKSNLENITDTEFPVGTIFIIYYIYKDDACSDHFSNKITLQNIADRKEFNDPIKSSIEKKYPNTVFMVLYDNGIAIQTDSKAKKEYFFSDKENYLRKTIFKTPTVCGSFGIIKPDGTTLVRNGEHRADWMAEHLNPEIWDSIFKTQ